MFRKMPFILLAIIIAALLFGEWIPPHVQSLLYALSLSIKSLIVFVLPVVIFGLLFKTASHFTGKASKLIFLLLAAICCSNFISTLSSYTVGALAYQFDLSIAFPDESSALSPAWDFFLPKWIGNAQAMFSGLFLGVFLGWLKPDLTRTISEKLDRLIGKILKAILFTIPLFISGFVVKINYDKMMPYILQHYAIIFILIASSLALYIGIIYLAVNRGNFIKAFQNIKNILPAAIAGFGSMSSAAAMPLTLLGAEKNSKNPDIPRFTIPATVNIHLIGDCFAIPIFAFAVLKSFGIAEPSFANYLIFAAYFVLAKFSVAGVPGGGILVMLPILEAYLGFNAEMLSLITALYILFDPVITCANIMGNGGFAMAFERMERTSPAVIQENQI